MGAFKQTRRKFLKSSVAALAAPQAFAMAANRPAASERIALGHIGMGGRGTAVQESFQELNLAQSVAVADPFHDRRDNAVRRIDRFYANESSSGSYKGCAAYNDFRDLLARDDIDAVIVATPDHWHVPIAILAARAGKDLYVEKPLGISIAQDRALRAEIHRLGNVFQYGTQQRSERNFRFACELVRNGYIGKLNKIQVWCPQGGRGGSTEAIPVPEGFDYDLWLGPAPVAPYTSDRCLSRGGYWIYDYSLGFIAGWGVHPLDIAQWGCGADGACPVEYEGWGDIPRDGLYTTIASWDFRCTYANGVEMRFMSADVAAPVIQAYRPEKEHGTTFFGEEGWVSVDRAGVYADPPSLLETEIGPNEIHLYASENHRLNFLDCIKTRKETICPIDTAVQVDILSQLCDISVRVGRKIRWDPDHESIVGDPEAERYLSRPMRGPWTL